MDKSTIRRKIQAESLELLKQVVLRRRLAALMMFSLTKKGFN